LVSKNQREKKTLIHCNHPAQELLNKTLNPALEDIYEVQQLNYLPMLLTKHEQSSITNQ
jgi:hypothetical protein